MHSADGEKVTLKDDLYPRGNVEDWMSQLEKVMCSSLRKTLGEALEQYVKVSA